MKTKIKWAYCRQCRHVYPVCPICGNNCCNACSGEIDGKPCITCIEVYNVWDELRRLDLVPNSKGLPRTDSCIGPSCLISRWLFLGKIKVRVANFFFDIFHNPEKYQEKMIKQNKEWKKMKLRDKLEKEKK
jgi:hypothetical protein